MSLVEEVGTGLDGLAQLRALISSGRKPGILLALDFETNRSQAVPPQRDRHNGIKRPRLLSDDYDSKTHSASLGPGFPLASAIAGHCSICSSASFALG